MLTGRMPAAKSQLHVNRSFVLRHLSRGYGPEVLTRTLLADESRRTSAALQAPADRAQCARSRPAPSLPNARPAPPPQAKLERALALMPK